jgi:hypothetical protein
MTQVNTIYPDPDGTNIWFGSMESLIRYNKTLKKNYNQYFYAQVRKVIANENLIFDGYRNQPIMTSKVTVPTLKYKDRNLHFEFASPLFEVETGTQYKYFLEGYDDQWSDWTFNTQKDYTNLDSGLYTFRVRAKNVYGNLSSEDFFQFKILLPWYRTWWAFSIYTISAFLLIILIVKWRSWKLEKEKQTLEQIIKERTKEIRENKQQLEKLTFQLKEQSEKLKEMDKMKSRFP